MITHREKGVICDICGEEVADKRALMNHKASHANTVSVTRTSLTEKVFPCTSCGKVIIFNVLFFIGLLFRFKLL